MVTGDAGERSAPGDLAAALRRCAGGDRAALQAIYDAEAPRMLGVALRLLHRRALAEEVVHEAFLRIWQRAGSYQPSRGDARGWIYAILRNLALNMLRSEGRVDLVDDFGPMELASEEEGPESIVMRLSEGSRLRRCLEGLDAVRRQAVVLAYVQGLTHGELAGRLGVPLGTVKSWIRRSLLALRECMA
ncbi:MAG: sigma-70 family RNA polymerase sigma factor [Alphaproteobacteria bacterium]|nr:sigma-70 family RNA polymerase sigma factor [Alphaproteobacteria bacterium]